MLKVRFDTLRCYHEAEAAGTARKTLADPNAYDLAVRSRALRPGMKAEGRREPLICCLPVPISRNSGQNVGLEALNLEMGAALCISL